MHTIKVSYTAKPERRDMKKKDKVVTGFRTDDLEHVNEELEYLLDIEDKMMHRANLYQRIAVFQKANLLKPRGFKRYGNTLQKA